MKYRVRQEYHGYAHVTVEAETEDEALEKGQAEIDGLSNSDFLMDVETESIEAKLVEEKENERM